MLKLGLAGLMIFCIGCRFDSPTPPPAGSPRTESIRPERQPQRSERTLLIEQLTAAQAHWIAVAPMSYQLTVSRTCFCDPGAPLVSRVAGVTVVESTGGHQDDGRNWGPPLRTVELLFVEARRAYIAELIAVR